MANGLLEGVRRSLYRVGDYANQRQQDAHATYNALMGYQNRLDDASERGYQHQRQIDADAREQARLDLAVQKANQEQAKPSRPLSTDQVKAMLLGKVVAGEELDAAEQAAMGYMYPPKQGRATPRWQFEVPNVALDVEKSFGKLQADYNRRKAAWDKEQRAAQRRSSGGSFSLRGKKAYKARPFAEAAPTMEDAWAASNVETKYGPTQLGVLGNQYPGHFNENTLDSVRYDLGLPSSFVPAGSGGYDDSEYDPANFEPALDGMIGPPVPAGSDAATRALSGGRGAMYGPPVPAYLNRSGGSAPTSESRTQSMGYPKKVGDFGYSASGPLESRAIDSMQKVIGVDSVRSGGGAPAWREWGYPSIEAAQQSLKASYDQGEITEAVYEKYMGLMR